MLSNCFSGVKMAVNQKKMNKSWIIVQDSLEVVLCHSQTWLILKKLTIFTKVEDFSGSVYLIR